jgi:hypothetical protein
MDRDNVQHLALRCNAVVVLHAQLLEHDTHLTSSLLQPLFVDGITNGEMVQLLPLFVARMER